MSIDNSLKGASNLGRHRNVLNRVERLETLKDAEKWAEGKTVYGLPKVGHRKQEIVKAAKETATDAAATPAAGGKAAPAAKGAAPAKAAAPAAKAPAKK